jgi:glycosyltransferase involved in cell wall biosynthesis
MKIAYICADPGIAVLGNKGASVHVREFTEALVELGHEVHIYSAGASANGAGIIDQNTTRVALTVLPPSENTKNAARLFAAGLARLDGQQDQTHLFSEVQHVLADPAFVNAALPLLQDFAPDLIIARHALFSMAGLALAQRLGCPCVLEVNAPLIEERRRYWGLTLEREAEQIERAVFAGVDLLVAVSEGVRSYLLRYDAPPDRIIVLPNGVNLTRFHAAIDGTAVRHRYGLEGKTVIGFSGSLKPWHGVDLLLRAFASVHAILSYCRPGRKGGEPGTAGPHLLIIGDGPQREPLMRQSSELGVSAAVTFTGAVPHSEVPAHLAALDIAVAPYVSSDGFYFSPLKVMEYLAMGRATIAPMLGQLPSLLQGAAGPCGLLYRPDDQHELAAALLRLIRDGELRRQLGARAAAQARLRSSWQTIARQIIERTSCGQSSMLHCQLIGEVSA